MVTYLPSTPGVYNDIPTPNSEEPFEAIKKAHQEYEVYRAALPDTLSDVEKAYLDSLRNIQKNLKTPRQDVTVVKHSITKKKGAADGN